MAMNKYDDTIHLTNAIKFIQKKLGLDAQN